MATYEIEVDVTLTIPLEVDAESSEEALDAAHDEVGNLIDQIRDAVDVQILESIIGDGRVIDTDDENLGDYDHSE